MRLTRVLPFIAVAAGTAALAQAQAAPGPSANPSPAPPAGEKHATPAPAAGQTTFSGYIQARAVTTPDGDPESDLFVRRARLAVRHTFDLGQIVLSFDGGQNSVTVKDAYIDVLVRKASGRRAGVTLRGGQFFRPFGFEIERSSAEREFAERPAGWGVLFPGNRDQGFVVSVALPATTFDAAVVNGNGTSTTGLSFRDSDDRKDVVLRVRQTLLHKRVELAGSVYIGGQRIAGVTAQAAQRGFVDTNGNGRQDAGEAVVVVTPARAATAGIDGDRDRWSAALHVPHLAGGSLRAEYIGAHDVTTSLVAGPARDTATARAFFASYVHPVGAGVSVGARYDEFDPDTADGLRPGGDGEQKTFGVVALRELGGDLRFTLAWERRQITVYDKVTGASRDDTGPRWTFQLQGRFCRSLVRPRRGGPPARCRA